MAKADKPRIKINYGKNENPPIDIDEVFIGDEPARYLKAGSHSYKETDSEVIPEKKEE